jgi:hypothetical protein
MQPALAAMEPPAHRSVHHPMSEHRARPEPASGASIAAGAWGKYGFWIVMAVILILGLLAWIGVFV